MPAVHVVKGLNKVQLAQPFSRVCGYILWPRNSSRKAVIIILNMFDVFLAEVNSSLNLLAQMRKKMS